LDQRIYLWLNEEISRKKSKSEIALMPGNSKSVSFAMMEGAKELEMVSQALPTMVELQIDYLVINFVEKKQTLSMLLAG